MLDQSSQYFAIIGINAHDPVENDFVNMKIRQDTLTFKVNMIIYKINLTCPEKKMTSADKLIKCQKQPNWCQQLTVTYKSHPLQFFLTCNETHSEVVLLCIFISNKKRRSQFMVLWMIEFT